MEQWVTSDLHFYHKNIFKFCKTTRPWQSVEEMNAALIKEWNQKVAPGDIIYHLGDFSFGNQQQTEEIVSQLNGNVFAIKGNHDSDKTLQIMRKHNWNVFTYYETYYTRGKSRYKVCMFHYPIHEWNQIHRGALHIHGHSHGTVPRFGRRLDVGYDSLGRIAKLSEVCDYLLTKEIEIPQGGHDHDNREQTIIDLGGAW